MIKLYTTESCTHCKELKKNMKEKNIVFEEINDVVIMKSKNIKFVPVIEIDEILLNSKEAFEYVESFNKKIDARKLMSDAKFYEGYARYIDSENRYETWNESVDRVMNMHKEFYKDKLTTELETLMKEVEVAYKDKLFLGAQRALQFGGKQLLDHVSRMYNCSSSHCDRPDFFGGMFYLLLSGAGVGFSVQKQHIAKLPKIKKRVESSKVYKVDDSIEGWASTIDVLLSSYFENGGKHPEYRGKKVFFDLSAIRPKGAFISGGFKAPGSEPLRKALDIVETLLENEIKNGNNTIRPIVAYDICMYISDAVISGGKK